MIFLCAVVCLTLPKDLPGLQHLHSEDTLRSVVNVLTHPFGEKSMANAFFRWPSRRRIHLPDLRSHTLPHASRPLVMTEEREPLVRGKGGMEAGSKKWRKVKADHWPCSYQRAIRMEAHIIDRSGMAFLQPQKQRTPVMERTQTVQSVKCARKWELRKWTELNELTWCTISVWLSRSQSLHEQS